MPRSRFEHLQPLLLPILNRFAMRSISASTILIGDFDLAIVAVMQDEPLVDEAFEHFVAEALDAGGGQRVAADVLAVDDGHHVVLAGARRAAIRRWLVERRLGWRGCCEAAVCSSGCPLRNGFGIWALADLLPTVSFNTTHRPITATPLAMKTQRRFQAIAS